MQAQRALALDALRGFAILTMVLSGVIPFGVLPAWMYHAQVPPPLHKFDPAIPGITWVDLVFPFFLFALGAAIPLALSKRLESGMARWRIALGILERGFLLGTFAIFIQHVKPHALNPSPTDGAWLTGLLGFALLFLMYSRFPQEWNWQKRWSLRLAGWIGAIVLLAFLNYPDGTGFSLNRSNIIIVVLTNAAVFGGLIWLLTQNNLLLRLGGLGILIALRLAHNEAGWVQWLWNASPAPWIYKLYYLQYLFIVIPGTIAGDMLLAWRHAADRTSEKEWNAPRLAGVVAVAVSLLILMLVNLKARWLTLNLLVTVVLLAIGGRLLAQPNNKTEELLKNFFAWGAYWLVLGLVFEPFEGGIKKDHPTLSYYFVTTGLALFLLITFMVLIDIGKRERWFRILIDNGQNPMIAYVGIANFIVPVLHLTRIDPLLQALTPTPWLGFLRGCLMTFLLALVVSFFTRKKICWRT